MSAFIIPPSAEDENKPFSPPKHQLKSTIKQRFPLSHSQKKETDSVSYDRRAPYYLGDWERAIPEKDKHFATENLDEPHLKRKFAMLADHPEIPSLFGFEPSTKWIALSLVSIQLFFSYLFGTVLQDWNSLPFGILFFAVAWTIGGTITQTLGLIIHEVCHGLCFEKLIHNRFLGLFTNIAIPFPIAMSFRRYHLEHHAFQGVENKDPDLPLKWEISLIRGSPIRKALFLFFYPLMYVVRGLMMQKTPRMWEWINIAWTITTNVLVWKLCGGYGFFYLFSSLWLGYGIHPAAGHFIQEHYTFDDGQETYSYYGSMNPLILNVGYHNEHHDFTKIPWSRLPELKKMAPEYYDHLFYHTSWWKVLYDFIFDPKLGPISRLERSMDAHKTGRKNLKN